MASDQIDTGAPALSSQGPPDADPNPPGQDQNIESALRQINTNMGTMTQLLTDVCARLPTTEAHRAASSSWGHKAHRPKTAVRFHLLR